MKIIKIKTSEGSLGRNVGCEKAPDEIVKELENIWLSENFKKINFSSEDSDLKNIKEGDIYLGGDHSITYHIIKKLSEKNEVGLVIFDAHPDVFQEFDFPTHGDWLKFLINKNIIKEENIILIGVRNSDEKEIQYLKEKNIKYYTAKQIFLNIENVCNSMMESAKNFEFLYLSIDIDSLDPAFAPGTGYLEPGGLSTRELLYFIQRLKLLKNLKAADIVEVNPDKDIDNVTVKLAAKLIGELI